MSTSKTSVALAAALLFLLHVVTVRTTATEPPSPDVHDLLPKFGLPKGLVPDSVTAYSLSEDGIFEIDLERACYVKFSELVYYEKKITGRLSYGEITDLTGIQAKKLFIWVSVTGIKVNEASNQIEFQVGFLSETLPAAQFEEIRTCQAGVFRADLLLGTSSVAEV